jgi:hypothetical protein
MKRELPGPSRIICPCTKCSRPTWYWYGLLGQRQVSDLGIIQRTDMRSNARNQGGYVNGSSDHDHLLPMSQHAHDGRELYLFSHSKKTLQLEETAEA